MANRSYLNSNVSLISKASIRYEGTLCLINPQEATITLSKVKSYGTEDRKVSKFLPPKDTLFEYIIFKANDIKELIVEEPLNDPAILTAQALDSGFNNESQSNVQAGNGLPSDSQPTSNGTANQATGGVQNVSSAGQAGERFRSRGSTPISSHERSPISEWSSGNKDASDQNKVIAGRTNNNNGQSSNVRNQNNQQRRGWDNNNRANNYNPRNYNNNQMNRRPGYQNNYQNNYNRGPGNFRPRNDDRMSNHMNNNRNGPRNQNYNSMNNNNRLMVRGGNRKFVPQSNKKFDATLKTEFDFEKANEVFQQMVDKLEELNISLNGEKVAEKSGSEDKEETVRTDVEKSDKVEDDRNFYDKTKSFFDNISCEAIERTKGSQKRFDWKQERKLNAETFGLKVSYRRTDGFRPDFRRPNGGHNNNGGYNRNNMGQNRRYNNAPNQSMQPRNAPRTSSS